jgi:hypothetical protein
MNERIAKWAMTAARTPPTIKGPKYAQYTIPLANEDVYSSGQRSRIFSMWSSAVADALSEIVSAFNAPCAAKTIASVMRLEEDYSDIDQLEILPT